MSWRSVRSAAGVGVRLMHGWARMEDHGRPRQRLVSAVAGRRLLAVCPDEWWCARSTKHRGWAVVPPVLPSFLPDVLLLLPSDKLLLLDVGADCFLLMCLLLDAGVE